MPQTITFESESEFVERNGGHALPLDEASGWMILPTGAKFNQAFKGYRRQEAPTDKIGSLEARLAYYSLLAADFRQKADSLIQWFNTQCGIYTMGSGPLPDQEDLSTLEDCMLEMARASKVRDELQAELRQLKGPSREELQAAAMEERRRQSNSVLDKVKAMTGRDYRAEMKEVDDMVNSMLKNATEALNAKAGAIAKKHGLM